MVTAVSMQVSDARGEPHTLRTWLLRENPSKTYREEVRREELSARALRELRLG